ISLSATLSAFMIFIAYATHPTKIYTLSLHDALPISAPRPRSPPPTRWRGMTPTTGTPRPSSSSAESATSANGRSTPPATPSRPRSEEHTSELQSRENLVCRLLLEKKQYTVSSETKQP